MSESDGPKVSPAEKAALIAVTHLTRAVGDLLIAVGHVIAEKPEESVDKLGEAQSSLFKVQETLEKFLTK